ncbi:DUF2207 domain-containing protein [Anaerofustis sp.]|uniref:DUF2207 family protein n=1 Tax=Anaerofustis sp. TaxID=1872517 RepID=UPI0025C493FA|nr:DUF2207 domain-containing protein [Anaerofustis sp.]
MNQKKEKVQQSIILLILAIVIGVVIYVTQKLLYKKLPPNILTILLLCTVLLLIIDLVIYFIWGMDKRVERKTSLYPPREMDSFVIGYLDTGEVQSNHFSSLIISLAVKKYLKIFKDINGDIVITKLKDLDDKLSKFERLMFKILFIGNKNKITGSDITNSCGRYFKKMETIIGNTFSNDKNIETKTSRKLRKFTGFLFAILVIVSFVIYSLFAFRALRFRITFAILLFILAGFMYALLSHLIIAYQAGNDTYVKYAALITSIFILCGNISVPYFVIHFSNVGIMFMCQLNLLLLCVIVNGFIFKRSDYLNSVLAKITGFKHHLEKYNKNEIYELYKKDKKYFYEILPYIFSFELSLIIFDGNENEIKTPYFYSTYENNDKIEINKFNDDMDIIDNAILDSY